MKIEKTPFIVQYVLYKDEKEYRYCDAQNVPAVYNLLSYFPEYVEIIDHHRPGQFIKLKIVAVNTASSFKAAKDAARELNNESILYGWLDSCYKY